MEGSLLGEDYSWLESAECPDDLQSSDYLKIETLDLDEVPQIVSRDEAGYVTEISVQGETLEEKSSAVCTA